VIINPKAPLDTARLLVKARHTAHGFRTLHHQQSIFSKWVGTHYREHPTEETRADIYGFLEGAATIEAKQMKPYKPNANSVNQVVDAMRAACQLPNNIQAPAWIENAAKHPPAGEIIACRNGLLHVPTGHVHKHTPAFFGTSSLSYAYDRKAPLPIEWLSFLNTIWGADQASTDTLQDIFGYLLGFDTDQQKLFLIVGPKRSGKGTIGRVLNALIGEDAVISPTLASLQTNFGVAPLIGKSVALIADARLGSRADQHAIAERLLSISGEDKQTIDRKFLPAWNGKLNTRFVIMTNELPRISDSSGALASRFVVLTMTNSFYGQEDRGLLARLLEELPGILNWALEGWRRVRERGHFDQPDASRDAIQELEDLGSPITAFVRERCVIAAGKTVSPEDLYAVWVAWCEEQGRDHPGTKATFGKELRSVFPGLKSRQVREEHERDRRYEGIGIQEGFEIARKETVLYRRGGPDADEF
jgi:putative DNA primase/helicase